MPELGYHWEPPSRFIEQIEPLMYIRSNNPPEGPVAYGAICKICGDVTRRESNGILQNATMVQAQLYVQRHLARHLAAISNEIAKFCR